MGYGGFIIGLLVGFIMGIVLRYHYKEAKNLLKQSKQQLGFSFLRRFLAN